MQDKTVIVVSSLVDATIREYSPDTEFLIFKLPIELGDYLDKNPIRATTMFVTEDTLGQTNSTLQYLRSLIEQNTYLTVDKVVFLVTDGSVQHKAVDYLIHEFQIDNWEVIIGSLSKAYVTEVINGTYRSDSTKVKHKAVYRVPRTDYVRGELKNRESLQEKYVDDENDLKDIPDEPVPVMPVLEKDVKLKKCFIAGDNCEERSAFAFLASQYLALSGKTIIVESDVDYHTITEYATKSGVNCYLLEIKDLFGDLNTALNNIRNSKEKLIIIGTIDRLSYSYRFLLDVLFYNLQDAVDYLVCEVCLSEVPMYQNFTLVVPSTMKGILSIGEQLDSVYHKYAKFVGVNLKNLPEVHLNSGTVMSLILRDVLSFNNALCPVVTISNLRLNGSVYDLGAILNGGD